MVSSRFLSSYSKQVWFWSSDILSKVRFREHISGLILFYLKEVLSAKKKHPDEASRPQVVEPGVWSCVAYLKEVLFLYF